MVGEPTTTRSVRGMVWPRRWVFVLLLLLVALAIYAGWNWLANLLANQSRAKALWLAEGGQFSRVEHLLLQALQRRPDDIEVVKALALGRLSGKDPATAEEPLSRWCEWTPDESRPFLLRMDLRRRIATGKWSPADRLQVLGHAAEDGRRILQLEPDNDAVRRELCGLLVQIGRFAEAEPLCRQCLMIDSTEPWILYLLAQSCVKLGKREEAETALDKIFRERKEFAEAVILRAVLYREAEQFDRAVTLLRQALLLPKVRRKECLYQLGLALAAKGNEEEARKVMAEVDRLTLEESIHRDSAPNNPAMQVQIAEAILASGKAEEARSRLQEILSDNPHFPPAHRVLAIYYDRLGDTQRATWHRERSGWEKQP